MTPRRSTRRHGGKGGQEPRARIQQRAEQVLMLASEGCSQHQIAKQLGISQSAVSKILRRLAEQHVTANKDAFEQQLFVAERKYGLLYQKAMEGYTRSLQPRTRRTQRKPAASDPQAAVAAEIQVTDSSGDPRFLEQARKAMEKLEYIQGITAVLRKGRPGVVLPISPLPDVGSISEQLRAKLQLARERTALAMEPENRTTPPVSDASSRRA